MDDSSKRSQTPQSRREFCAGACQMASGATLAALASACSGGGGGASPTSPSGMSGGGSSTSATAQLSVMTGSVVGGAVQVQTGSGALGTVGGAAQVQSSAGTFLVTRTGQNTFAAVTATCTHEACAITGLSSGTYVCPCHGSRFTSGGQVLNGPATASLRTFATSLSGDTLSIAV